MAREVLDINTDPPTLSEVKDAINAIKSGKAGGLDGVTADMLKAEDVMASILVRSFLERIWNGEETP